MNLYLLSLQHFKHFYWFRLYKYIRGGGAFTTILFVFYTLHMLVYAMHTYRNIPHIYYIIKIHVFKIFILEMGHRQPSEIREKNGLGWRACKTRGKSPTWNVVPLGEWGRRKWQKNIYILYIDLYLTVRQKEYHLFLSLVLSFLLSIYLPLNVNVVWVPCHTANHNFHSRFTAKCNIFV